MRRLRKRLILAAVLVSAASLAVGAWYYLFRDVPVYFASNEDHFKYGSVGVEAATGVPYWIWVVLPDVFPDKLAGADGYRGFGFVWEPGRATPVGMPLKTVGFPRVGVNCALCHVGSIRTDPSQPRELLLGAPNTTLDLQRYLRFLYACASDPRFNARNILPAIAARHDLSLIERLLYRYVLIPQMKKTLLTQKQRFAWMDAIAEPGPGRVDPFNPAKIEILGRPYDGTIGNADIVSLWNWQPRRNFGLHWDGLNNSLTEIFLNSGIGNGATNRTIDRDGLARLQAWVQGLPPARFPFAIDPDRAGRGKTVFDSNCASCHAFGGAKTGTVIPIEWLGTDRHRLDSWTDVAATAFNALDQYRWRYRSFRKTGGYVAVPLDGIWARAPYLHNGSVPTLWDLLMPVERRPRSFYRGYNVYDPKTVGFISAGSLAAAEGRKFDADLPGNGNQGHDYGTALPEASKWDLIEYLKTQ